MMSSPGRLRSLFSGIGFGDDFSDSSTESDGKGQTDRQNDRQTDRHTDTQTDNTGVGKMIIEFKFAAFKIIEHQDMIHFIPINPCNSLFCSNSRGERRAGRDSRTRQVTVSLHHK